MQLGALVKGGIANYRLNLVFVEAHFYQPERTSFLDQ